MFFWFKVFLSGLTIALASELTKRAPWMGGLLVALPLVSILTLVWTYTETKDVAQVSSLSWSVFWYVLPTLGFFILLPVLIRWGLNFWLALTLSSLALAFVFVGYRQLLGGFGIKL